MKRHLHVAVTAVLTAWAGCLPPAPSFGRPCSLGCAPGDFCVDGACVPDGFALPDAGAPPDAGEEPDAGPPPTGEDCGAAIPLAFGVETDGSTVDRFDDVSNTCLDRFGTRDVVYRIEMPAEQALRITVDASFWVYLEVLTSCLAEPIEGGCDSSNLNHITMEIAAPPPGPLFIVIESQSADDEGIFTLRATTIP